MSALSVRPINHDVLLFSVSPCYYRMLTKITAYRPPALHSEFRGPIIMPLRICAIESSTSPVSDLLVRLIYSTSAVDAHRSRWPRFCLALSTLSPLDTRIGIVALGLQGLSSVAWG
jgi:hypothetical protein